MNINTIIEKKASFDSLVIDSGFYRDIQEYINNIGEPQNSQNIVLLKDIADKVLKKLESYQQTDLPDDIRFLLPDENKLPFTDPGNIISLKELIGDPTIDTQNFHSKLNEMLEKISSQIASNQNDINAVYNILQPYYQKQKEVDVSEGKALLSFIFKDPLTIRNLKQFQKALSRWVRALHEYHLLISAESPKDIELVNIQNGSIDVLVNINLDIAISFTDILKYGLIAFTGYLTYKTKVHEIVATYLGNRKLIKSEEEREKGLLDNIGVVVRSQLSEQHKNAIKKNSKINQEGIDVKINEVTKVITDHIVKGNDVKLLTGVTENEELQKLKQDTEKASLEVRNGLKSLDEPDRKLLLEHYAEKEKE